MRQQGLTAKIHPFQNWTKPGSKFPDYLLALTYSTPSFLLSEYIQQIIQSAHNLPLYPSAT